ncbi:peroxidasin homolog cardinal [Arctopsyche grandis]|uniref:peroxidasin homolog cardinal n=1 Tax=Arctopsyche grandis TaxID=121162 RepID=UPI00406D7C0C
MDQQQPSTSEQTPLIRPSAPTYVFSSVSARQRRSRLKKVQCFICGTFILVFTVALVITISYDIDHPNKIDENTTSGNLSQADFTLTTLLALSWPRTDVNMSDWSNTSLDQDLKEAEKAGTEAIEARTRFEKSASYLTPGSPAQLAQKALAATPPSALLAKAGYAKDYATKYFVRNKPFKVDWCIGRGPTLNASWTLPECFEDPKISCPPSKYRAINGTCNNKQHPLKWGVAFVPFRRAIPPSYADGVSSPRVASDGSNLPSARQVSIQVHRPEYREDPEFTVVLAVWGQFLDHDITATALSQGANGGAISCCEIFESAGLLSHPECFPVKLEPGDPNYDKYNVTCMEFVRSAPAPSCTLGPREQLNQASAYIDGSTVYGPYDNLTISLRSFEDGQLKMMTTPDGRELLPASHDPNDGCNEAKMNALGKYCFLSGDIRANENLHLTTMHLLWARQHNRLARSLHKLNPSWNDEALFQESRRILGAQMQHITYNEFLPVLMGSQLMERLELSPKSEGYYSGYNASLEPNIANNFAASAFRFAHTLLPTLMKVANSQSNMPEYVHLHKMLFNPYSLYNQGGLDNAIKGAMQTDMQRVDAYFTPELTSHLFKRDNLTTSEKKVSPCGLDLVSLNIQRGRDHGLPSYPAWREYCGFQRPTSFEDLNGVIDPASLYRISSIYKSIDDVDLYTAALSEIPIQGRVLGPTITCLLVDQFTRLKRGDRFWYETSEKPQAFTKKQLNEIRKTTLAGIICRNGDALEDVQLYVMRSVGSDNPLIKCSTIPEPDLGHWVVKPLVKIGLSSGLGTLVTIFKPSINNTMNQEKS